MCWCRCSTCCRCPEGLTCMLVLAIFASVLGMFQFGYNLGVINAPQKVLEDFISTVYNERTGMPIPKNFKDWLWAITVAVFAIGGMVGGISGGMMANRFGRKGGLLINNIMGILGGSLMGFSNASRSIELLIFGRLIIGINCGLNTALVPMYLLEISPVPLRGGLGTVSQVGVTVGMLLSQILGIDVILGTEEGWPYLLAIAVIPAVLQLLLLPFCPESPRYLLISKQQESLAREALQKLRCSSMVEDDIEEMKTEEQAQQQEAKVTMMQVITTRSLQLPLLIGVLMHLSQQLSGIIAVFYYSVRLFEAASLPPSTANIFITISLLVKFLYHWITYMSVVSTLCFVVFFAIGPGTIPWMLMAELFSQGPRPAAMSIGVLINWSANFIVSLIFPPNADMKLHNAALGNYTFLPFTVLLGFFWTFTYKKVPETKNRTFEEISALFRRDDVVSINGMGTRRNSLAPGQDAVYEEKPETYGTFSA
ncbi:hypothetical protein MRX96_008958 [Rhipicephalus microplus]